MPIDYSKYPDKWKTEIRPAILYRATNCCELCGLENRICISRNKANPAITTSAIRENTGTLAKRGYSPIIEIVLTIEHLDGDKGNNDEKNLMALCQRCHLIWDKKHRQPAKGEK